MSFLSTIIDWFKKLGTKQISVSQVATEVANATTFAQQISNIALANSTDVALKDKVSSITKDVITASKEVASSTSVAGAKPALQAFELAVDALLTEVASIPSLPPEYKTAAIALQTVLRVIETFSN